jgi:hypothetical protein
VSAIDSNGRTIWIADAHRGDGQRLVVRADRKFTAFLELESLVMTRNRIHVGDNKGTTYHEDCNWTLISLYLVDASERNGAVGRHVT